MIRNPHHIPARKVIAVIKIIATTMTSTTAPNHAGKLLINAISVSSMCIFPFSYAPTGTIVTIALGTAGLVYGVLLAANASILMFALGLA